MPRALAPSPAAYVTNPATIFTIAGTPPTVCPPRCAETGRGHIDAIEGSEIPIDGRVAEAHEFEDGKVVRSLIGFADVALALEAVGIVEQDRFSRPS